MIQMDNRGSGEGTYLAMLRCTKISPGLQARTTLSGTRESAQPIQRTCVNAWRGQYGIMNCHERVFAMCSDASLSAEQTHDGPDATSERLLQHTFTSEACTSHSRRPRTRMHHHSMLSV